MKSLYFRPAGWLTFTVDCGAIWQLWVLAVYLSWYQTLYFALDLGPLRLSVRLGRRK